MAFNKMQVAVAVGNGLPLEYYNLQAAMVLFRNRKIDTQIPGVIDAYAAQVWAARKIKQGNPEDEYTDEAKAALLNTIKQYEQKSRKPSAKQKLEEPSVPPGMLSVRRVRPGVLAPDVTLPATNVLAVFEGGEAGDVTTEDSGQAKIFRVDSPDDGECGLFVNIQSWCECGNRKHHPKWFGKKVRITIEEII